MSLVLTTGVKSTSAPALFDRTQHKELAHDSRFFAAQRSRLRRAIILLELLLIIVMIPVLAGGLLMPADNFEPLCACSLDLGFSIDGLCNPSNPLVLTITVTGCSYSPTITASLTDDDGEVTYAEVCGDISFPEMPAGDYSLTVEAQCGSKVVARTQDITLSPCEAKR